MAKIGELLPKDQIPPEVGNVVAYIDGRSGKSARQARQQLMWSYLKASEMAMPTRDASAAWQALPRWKQFRWSLCAWRMGVAASPVMRPVGWSGFTLFLTCWKKQKIRPGHQPISPCSRRLNDPNASPHDYSP